jgi:hypothetical protein
MSNSRRICLLIGFFVAVGTLVLPMIATMLGFLYRGFYYVAQMDVPLYLLAAILLLCGRVHKEGYAPDSLVRIAANLRWWLFGIMAGTIILRGAGLMLGFMAFRGGFPHGY